MATRVSLDKAKAISLAKTAICAGLEAVGIFYAKEVKKTLNLRKSGSSAPGQPPGNLTGALGRSIQVDANDCRRNLIVRVGSNLVYAAIQEFGGRISAKTAEFLHFMFPDGGWVRVKSVVLPPRPYFRPTLKKNLRKINKVFAKAAAAKWKRAA